MDSLQASFTSFQTQTETQISHLTNEIESLKANQPKPQPTPAPVDLSPILTKLDQLLNQTSTPIPTPSPPIPAQTISTLNHTISNLLSQLKTLRPSPPDISITIPESLLTIPSLLKDIDTEVNRSSFCARIRHSDTLREFSNLTEAINSLKPLISTSIPSFSPIPSHLKHSTSPFTQPPIPTASPSSSTIPPFTSTPTPTPYSFTTPDAPAKPAVFPSSDDDKKGEKSVRTKSVLQAEDASTPDEIGSAVEGENKSEGEQPAQEEQRPKRRLKQMARRTKKSKQGESCAPIELPSEDSDDDDEDEMPLSSMFNIRKQSSSTTAPPVQASSPVQSSQPTPSSSSRRKGKKIMTAEEIEEEERREEELNQEDENLRELSELAAALGSTIEEVLKAKERHQDFTTTEDLAAAVGVTDDELRELQEEEIIMLSSQSHPTQVASQQDDPSVKKVPKRGRTHREAIQALHEFNFGVTTQQSEREIKEVLDNKKNLIERKDPNLISRVTPYKGTDEGPYLRLVRRDERQTHENAYIHHCKLFSFTEMIETLYHLLKSKSEIAPRFINKFEFWIRMAVYHRICTHDQFLEHIDVIEDAFKKSSKAFVPAEQIILNPDHPYLSAYENFNTALPSNIEPEMFKYITEPERGIFFKDRAGVWRFLRETDLGRAPGELIFQAAHLTRGQTGSEHFENLIQARAEELLAANPLNRLLDVKEEPWWE